MKPLIIADSKDNLHDPYTLQLTEWGNGKNLFGFSRRSSHAENSFLNESQGKFAAPPKDPYSDLIETREIKSSPLIKKQTSAK